jgi:hypothetical protein
MPCPGLSRAEHVNVKKPAKLAAARQPAITVHPLAEQLQVAPSAQVMVHPPPLHVPIVQVSPGRHWTLHVPPGQSPMLRVAGVGSSLLPGPTWQWPLVHSPI